MFDEPLLTLRYSFLVCVTGCFTFFDGDSHTNLVFAA